MGKTGKDRIREYRERQKARGNKELNAIINKESAEIFEVLKKILNRKGQYTNGDIMDFILFLTRKVFKEFDEDFLTKTIREFKENHSKNQN